jgi:CheY-like chemotaxis protein
MMPGGMDGYEVTRILKRDPATADCAVVVMTATVQDQDRANAFEAGSQSVPLLIVSDSC